MLMRPNYIIRLYLSTFYAFTNEKVSGCKTAKERVILMCCVSLSGEWKKLLVIGKNNKPCCFKGVNTLPVIYKNNRNSWTTIAIFGKWFLERDKELNRDILLQVDNCTTHIFSPNLKRITVAFLSSHTTSLIQPCDQGIITAFTAYYKYTMRRRIL